MPIMEPTEEVTDAADGGTAADRYRRGDDVVGVPASIPPPPSRGTTNTDDDAVDYDNGIGNDNGNHVVGSPLVRPNEIAVYIQRPSLRLDDVLTFLTDVEPSVRFNFPKPPGLDRHLSDDAWAALQLRVDPAARNILDPHRYYAAAACVSVLITIVFYAIRPGYSCRQHPRWPHRPWGQPRRRADPS